MFDMLSIYLALGQVFGESCDVEYALKHLKIDGDVIDVHLLNPNHHHLGVGVRRVRVRVRVELFREGSEDQGTHKTLHAAHSNN